MRVVGIDLSMTSTGIAVAHIPHDPADSVAALTLLRIESAPLRLSARTGLNGKPSLRQRAERLDHVARDVMEVVDDGADFENLGAELVLIEGPSYSSKGSAFHQVAGLWWLTVQRILEGGYRLVEVPPSNRMIYATGKGNAGKDQVMLATARRYDRYAESDGNDQADALILAAMGARHLGRPLEESLPKTHLRAMDTVEWPTKETPA